MQAFLFALRRLYPDIVDVNVERWKVHALMLEAFRWRACGLTIRFNRFKGSSDFCSKTCLSNPCTLLSLSIRALASIEHWSARVAGEAGRNPVYSITWVGAERALPSATEVVAN